MEGFEKAIKDLLHIKPFRPFTVELVNGSKITIDRPEAVVVRGKGAVYLRPDGGLSIFETDAVSQIVGAPIREDLEKTIKNLLHTRPFRPFTLELENGSEVIIDHPEAVIVGGGRMVYVNSEGIASIFDAESVTRVTGPATSIKSS